MEQQHTQKIIVSQSMIKFVQEYAKQYNIPMSLKDMVGISNVMVDWACNGYSKEIGERLDSIDSYLKSKFEEVY